MVDNRSAGFYGIGVLSAFVQARVMVEIGQGTLRRLREDLFTHMESLPIKYFDTNTHGDIMSIYTNDIDTLRQMISQSIPQILSSAITIVSVLASMIVLSIPLTFVTLVMVAIMLFCSAKATKASGKNFVAQQKNIGELNGFIEEMMTGQKVVKVFNHEKKLLRDSMSSTKSCARVHSKPMLIPEHLVLSTHSLEIPAMCSVP